MPSPWTDDLISRLKDFWEKGFTCNEIAKALSNNITRSAVMGKVDRLGLIRWRHNAELAKRALSSKKPPTDIPAASADNPEPLLAIGPIGDFAGCRYIAGDPQGDFQCCGHPQKEQSVYCEFHHSICRVKPTGPKPGSVINLTARAARQFR